MSKTAFWKCKELLRRDVNMELKKRVLKCDVKSALSYGCKTWTLNKIIRRQVEVLQKNAKRSSLQITIQMRR